MSETEPSPIPEHVTRKASGRKATRKSETTRQQILDAAASLFAERGYSLTRLADIAQQAGIHLTGLYYYYDNKEELVSDIISHGPARAAEALRSALDALPGTASKRERLETAISVYLSHILKDDDYVRADHRIASQMSPEVRARALAISRDINSIWRNLLEEAAAAGEIRSDIDMTMLRMLMLGSMNWSVEWFRSDLAPPEGLAAALKVLFFEGAAPQSS
jgi:AcrR family transcriptional regulator